MIATKMTEHDLRTSRRTPHALNENMPLTERLYSFFAVPTWEFVCSLLKENALSKCCAAGELSRKANKKWAPDVRRYPPTMKKLFTKFVGRHRKHLGRTIVDEKKCVMKDME